VQRVIEAAAERDIANSLAFIVASGKKSTRALQADFAYVISHRDAVCGKDAIEVGARAANVFGNQVCVHVV